jgi:hypothetical protein
MNTTKINKNHRRSSASGQYSTVDEHNIHGVAK